MDLSVYTTQEIEIMRGKLNLTDDEDMIFQMLSKKRSINEISDKLQMSTRSVDRRIKQIRSKLEKLNI